MGREAIREAAARRFGTFGGVFVPSVLTLLGIILFLRVGWVLGNAGFWGAVAIIVLAHLITFATGLSLSAISTNVKVRTGGAYYLISRSLGSEIGGSIGIPLYLSQAISVAFYLIGFSQVVSHLVPWLPVRVTATIFCIGFGYIAYRGADIAIKVQYFIMALLGLALISFFAGGSPSAIAIDYNPNYIAGYNFWAVFAIFFPAAVGITSGVSMSGDLKNPARSIPTGTIAAILVTFAIYMAVMYWLSVNATAEELIKDEMIMYRIAKVPFLIVIGVFASTLSSALACVVAAPRTLMALSFDRIVPRFFARTMGSKTEPRMGVLVTFVIAEAVILMGNLNIVATIVTMFFLNTYGMTNLAAGLEKLIGSPSYRPKFNIHWSVSLLGAFGCYYAMFLIHAPATIVAIIASYGIFFLLERRSINQTWGDVRSGAWFTLSRFALLKLEDYKWHPKNWKPNMLVFCGNPRERPYLVDLIRWLSKGKGINTLAQLIIGEVTEFGGKEGMKALGLKNLRRYIQETKLEAFAQCEVVPDFENGVIVTAQAHGIGGVRPNAVLFGWSNDPAVQTKLVILMRKLFKLNKSMFMLKLDKARGFGKKRTIDVWWGGRGGNGDMMLLLAHLFSLHHDWRNAHIRLLTLIDHPEGKEKARENIDNLLREARLKKEPVILTKDRPDQPVSEVMRRNSGGTDLTILGLGLPESGAEAEYAARLREIIDPLGSVLMVRSVETEELL